MKCPHCDHENIPGADTCEECHQPLDHLSEPEPASPIEQRLVSDPVRVLQPKRAITVSPDESVRAALQMMVRERLGCVPVVENGQLVGIFSERDALLRIGPHMDTLGDKPVREFMTPEPETLYMDNTIVYALHKMDVGGYRHLPILDKETNQVAGIISVRDILNYLTANLG